MFIIIFFLKPSISHSIEPKLSLTKSTIFLNRAPVVNCYSTLCTGVLSLASSKSSIVSVKVLILLMIEDKNL